MGDSDEIWNAETVCQISSALLEFYGRYHEKHFDIVFFLDTVYLQRLCSHARPSKWFIVTRKAMEIITFTRKVGKNGIEQFVRTLAAVINFILTMETNTRLWSKTLYYCFTTK